MHRECGVACATYITGILKDTRMRTGTAGHCGRMVLWTRVSTYSVAGNKGTVRVGARAPILPRGVGADPLWLFLFFLPGVQDVRKKRATCFLMQITSLAFVSVSGNEIAHFFVNT